VARLSDTGGCAYEREEDTSLATFGCRTPIARLAHLEPKAFWRSSFSGRWRIDMALPSLGLQGTWNAMTSQIKGEDIAALRAAR
jgi:hypothetical protein